VKSFQLNINLRYVLHVMTNVYTRYMPKFKKGCVNEVPTVPNRMFPNIVLHKLSILYI
jgi:hypothetical protein